MWKCKSKSHRNNFQNIYLTNDSNTENVRSPYILTWKKEKEPNKNEKALHTSKDDIQMANKHVTLCLTSGLPGKCKLKWCYVILRDGYNLKRKLLPLLAII